MMLNKRKQMPTPKWIPPVAYLSFGLGLLSCFTYLWVLASGGFRQGAALIIWGGVTLLFFFVALAAILILENNRFLSACLQALAGIAAVVMQVIALAAIGAQTALGGVAIGVCAASSIGLITCGCWLLFSGRRRKGAAASRQTNTAMATKVGERHKTVTPSHISPAHASLPLDVSLQHEWKSLNIQTIIIISSLVLAVAVYSSACLLLYRGDLSRRQTAKNEFRSAIAAFDDTIAPPTENSAAPDAEAKPDPDMETQTQPQEGSAREDDPPATDTPDASEAPVERSPLPQATTAL